MVTRKDRPKLTAEQAATAKAGHDDLMARIEELVGSHAEYQVASRPRRSGRSIAMGDA